MVGPSHQWGTWQHAYAYKYFPEIEDDACIDVLLRAYDDDAKMDGDGHTCLSIWFSFCKVESLSSSSEFFFSKSLTLVSRSLKYAFFLSLACCAETLFLSNLIYIFCFVWGTQKKKKNTVIYQTATGPKKKGPKRAEEQMQIIIYCNTIIHLYLFSLLLSLSAGLLPLFLCPSPATWTRSGPPTEPVSLPEADAPPDSAPISGTLLISSSLSIAIFQEK